MTNIKEAAKAYKTPQTKNISDLDKVLVDQEIVEKEYTDYEGKSFKISVVEINGEDYRVPVTVLKGLKAMIVELPNLVAFKVNKQGEGMNTSYTVIPIE